MLKKIAAVIAAGVLAASVAPCAAFAVGGDSLAAGGQAAMAPQASSMAKVWVITGFGDSRFSDYKLTYNKKGQLTRMASDDFRRTFKYRNGRLASFKSEDIGGKNTPRSSSGTLMYDKKGRLKKIDSSGTFYSCSYVVTYAYDKKGRVVKAHRQEMPSPSTVKYTYDKKGRVAKATSSSGDSYKYAYDAKGNLKASTYRSSSGYESVYRYKNSYSGGRVARQVAGYGSYMPNTHTFKYKQVSVPRKYASQVKKQQWALVNPDVSFVFPTY